MAEHGVDAVGLAAITEAADLGVGTFYNCFQSRDEVVIAAVGDIVPVKLQNIVPMETYRRPRLRHRHPPADHR